MSAVDATCLERLAHDVSSLPFVVAFVEKYDRLLPERVRRVVGHIAEGDLDQALDAVLSLRVSSTFVGAQELVELSRRVEDHLRTGDLVGAALRAALIHEAAQRTQRALTAFVSELRVTS
ncbi:Hpt domain-containing protein [Nocardioides lijunqiniae]|uniref:Hpt domain-containing protein n=1 Tax=Nocardioides lijunqiniae TaxID=2760832 RepID=UPI00187817CE|nr:Hpt domain-containing protein [Nocardioides lijunqiniae]